MALSIKNKIASGIGILFALLLITGVVALVAINILSGKTENLLTANYKTIRFCNEMMHAIDRLPDDTQASRAFEAALIAQEKNITEPGESAATAKVRFYFERLKAGRDVQEAVDSINSIVYVISQMNQHALEHKNELALATAVNAKVWLTLLITLVILVGFSLTLNLPGVVAAPVKQITAGIREIAKANYKTRILLDNRDEFGEMATAFNRMAERLHEWEHSSIAQIMFEKSRVDTIINQMEDAVMGLDAEGRILFVNGAAAELFNLNPSELTGRHATHVAIHNDLLRTVLRNDSRAPLKIFVGGKEQFFTLNHNAVISDGKPLGDVFTLKNITHFKEMDLSKTNLLATISHELKTPISSIKMSAKLLEDARIGSMNDEQKEMVHSIADDAERLLRLTGELLNMTQVESGNIQLKFQHVAPGAIIQEAIQAVQIQAQQRGIAIHQSLPDNLPLIHADAEKTALVLVNLLANAIKYSPEGSVVKLLVQENNGKVLFSVVDEGEGIDPKYQARIFDRYFKVPSSINTTGTGLGLAISKEFIEAQGGELSVESRQGYGSTFAFVLPIAI